MPEQRENVESKIWQNGNNNNNNNFQRSAVIQSQGTEGSSGKILLAKFFKRIDFKSINGTCSKLQRAVLVQVPCVLTRAPWRKRNVRVPRRRRPRGTGARSTSRLHTRPPAAPCSPSPGCAAPLGRSHADGGRRRRSGRGGCRCTRTAALRPAGIYRCLHGGQRWHTVAQGCIGGKSRASVSH